MSRIHDALKKAEQEKTQAVPAGAETRVLEAPPASARATSAVLAPPAGPLNFETLAAHSRRFTWRGDVNKLMFLRPQSHGYGAEQLRTLRSRLYQIRDRMPLKTLLITSALPAEGKTFVCANLAHTFVRQHERRVLLIDADLRWSRLHALLGAPPEPGLTEYLMGQADELSILQRGSQDNLFLIPGGKSVSNPAELLGSGRIKHLLERLSPLFDWVILDSPPAIPVSDASLLADLCDGVLLVVEAGVTPFDVAQKLHQEFQEKRLVGVVLNRVDSRSMEGGYYYGYYGYPAPGHEGKNGSKRG